MRFDRVSPDSLDQNWLDQDKELTGHSVFTYIWVPETKAVPIECAELLFSGKMRHAAWRAKKLFPPNGIPPLPEYIAAGEAAYVEAHQGHYDVVKTKNERSDEIEYS